MRISFINFIVFLLFIFSFHGTLLKAGPEEELAELLIKRGKNILVENEQERIRPLFRQIRRQYRPLIKKNDDDARALLAAWASMVNDEDDSYEHLLNIANKGHTQAQYLAGLFNLHAAQFTTAFDWLSNAASNEHQDAFTRLTGYADNEKDPYAIYKLGLVYIDKKDYPSAAYCLERIRDAKFPDLNTTLRDGFICQLRSDYYGALKFYRQAIAENTTYARDFIEYFFQHPYTLLDALKAKAFTEDELKRVEAELIKFASADSTLLDKIKTLADEDPTASYVYYSVTTASTKPANKKGSTLLKNEVMGIGSKPYVKEAHIRSRSLINRPKIQQDSITQVPEDMKPKSYSAESSTIKRKKRVFLMNSHNQSPN